MRVRTLLIGTAIVSSILGAAAVYLTLTVPNDLKADSILKDARKELAAGQTDRARESLSRVVQQYPRTDAAAAATVALVKIADQENEKLRVELNQLKQETDNHARVLTGLGQSVESIKNAPQKTVTIEVPAKKPTPKRVTTGKKPAKKPTPAKKRTPTRRTRRG
jgi:hypothetical protein